MSYPLQAIILMQFLAKLFVKRMTDHESKIRFPTLDNITDSAGQSENFIEIYFFQKPPLL